MKKLTIKELERIVTVLDSKGVNLEIFINKDIEIEQETTYGYKFIKSDIVKGIAVTGGSFMGSGFDISFDTFMEIINFSLKPLGILIEGAYGEGTISYMPIGESNKRQVLWHQDKSIIGEYDIEQ